MTDPFYIREPSDLQYLARERVEQLGMTRLTIDWLAHLPGGYSSKILADPPIKRMSLDTALNVLRAVGLALVVVEDAEALKAVQEHIGTRREYRVNLRHRSVLHAQEARP